MLLALGFAISVRAGQAHHSIAGVYDTSQQVTVEGVVAEFQFVNPHPYVTVEVRQQGGEPQRWKLEMDNLSELVQAGMTKESLKPGDQVVVKGNPLRAKGQNLYIRKLERRADGFEYEQLGRSPSIRTPQ
jgi:hypothetical protein